MSSLLLVNASVIAGLMLITWLVSVPLRNVSIVDLIWGVGFVLVGWTTYGLSNAETNAPSRWLLPLMVTIWGGRLSFYLLWRNWGHGEDRRYVAMRLHRPAQFWWQSMYIVFGLQGSVMWVVALPLQFGIGNAKPGWSIMHGAGLALWALGVFFETVGDWQLARFKASPENRGRVLDRGLWRYTRHPNYFGDFCVWWGLYCVAIAHGLNYWTAIGPLAMSIFLMRVSGVTLLESTLKVEKPDYADYIRRTNTFFPGPPRPAAN